MWDGKKETTLVIIKQMITYENMTGFACALMKNFKPALLGTSNPLES